MAEKPNIRRAVVESIDLDDVQDLLAKLGEEPEEEENTELPEAAASGGEVDGDSRVETSPEPVTKDEAPAAAKAEEAEGTSEEPPLSWMGVDLRDFSPEKRTELIARFEKQEEVIRDANRRAAEAEKAAAAASPAEQAVEEVSDEDILTQLGVGPDHPYREVAQELQLPNLVKELSATRAQLQELAEEREAEKYTAHWNDRLDDLEQEYGKLPIERTDLLNMAVENGIFSPDDAYARAMLAPRKLQAEVDQERAAALEVLKEKKRASGASLKTSGARTNTTEKLTAANIRDAVKEVMPQVASKQEFDWKDFAATGLDGS